MKSDFKNYFYIFIAGCLWGTVSIFVKNMDAAGSSTGYTSFLRVFFGFLILAIITLIKEGPKAFRINKQTLIACILLGIFTQGFFNISYNTAIGYIGASLGAVLLYTAPLFTSVMSFFLFKEKITHTKALALLINIIGCAFTVTGGQFNAITFSVIGVCWGVAAGFFYSLGAILGKYTTGQASSLVVTTYNFLFASIFLGISLRPWSSVGTPLEPKLLLLGIAYAIIPTALAYAIYFTGVQRVKETSKIPIAASIETVSATIVGILVFHEAIGFGNLIGIALVLASIVIMNLNFSKATNQILTDQQIE